MDKWTPAGEGTAFQFSEILKPLEPFRDRVIVVSDLAHAPVAPGRARTPAAPRTTCARRPCS